jgi:hypothetical protein
MGAAIKTADKALLKEESNYIKNSIQDIVASSILYPEVIED